MTAPHREKILELARELFFKDNPDAPTPEEAELLEDGYYHTARNELMRAGTAFETYLEEQAAQNGYRVVTEEEHSKLVELEKAKAKLRNEKKRAKRLEAELEEARSLEKQNIESKLKEDIPFNIREALNTGVFISGTSGSGKSDIGMYAASLLMKNGTVVIVLDSSQDWLNRSSISHYQTLASSFIDKIPEHSIIYDISHLTIRQQQKLVEGFSRMLMHYQATIPDQERRQYFLVFEEAHTYFPEGCMRAKRFQNTVKMMTQGRNYKVRFMCITQFSSLVDKQTMRYMKQRYFGYTDEPNDIEYVTEFFDKEDRKGIATKLRSLKAGQFIYRYGSHNKLIQIEPFTTETEPIKLEAPEQPILQQPIQTEKPYRKSENSNALASIIIALLWFVAIVLALTQRL